MYASDLISYFIDTLINKIELIECLIKDGVVRLLDIISKQKKLMNSQFKCFTMADKDHQDIEEMLQALNDGNKGTGGEI